MSLSVIGTASAHRALNSARVLTHEDTREMLHRATAEERAEWLIVLQQLSDAVSAATLLATEVFDAHGDAMTLRGAASTKAWIRSACRTSGGEASDRVRLARSSRQALNDPLRKLAAGSITYEHLRLIERSVRHLDDAQQSDAVELLTTLAESNSVGDVRVAGHHLAQVVDPDGTLAASEQQFERRHLTLAPLIDGMTSVSGLLDPESAALVDAALRPFLTPDGPGDNRSHAQRRADGLVQILSSACDAQLVPQGGGERPHLNVVVSADGVAHLTPRREALHQTTVSRIACDALLTTLILDTHGTVVDLGRTQRLFSTRQRALLSSRDGGCRWPGCHRPPAHTDAHHVIPWAEGGPTDVVNALLLCRFHHRQVHEGRWRIEVEDESRGTNGTVIMIAPHGPRLTSAPRGP